MKTFSQCKHLLIKNLFLVDDGVLSLMRLRGLNRHIKKLPNLATGLKASLSARGRLCSPSNLQEQKALRDSRISLLLPCVAPDKQ